MKSKNWATNNGEAHYFFGNQKGKKRQSACSIGNKKLFIPSHGGDYEFLTYEELKSAKKCEACKEMFEKVYDNQNQ